VVGLVLHLPASFLLTRFNDEQSQQQGDSSKSLVVPDLSDLNQQKLEQGLLNITTEESECSGITSSGITSSSSSSTRMIALTIVCSDILTGLASG
jgi:hypothetical protein